MVSHRCLSDSKSSQVSRTFRNILGNLTNAEVWMVSTRPLIFKPSIICTNPLVIVRRVPITIGITVTFMFQSFFNILEITRHLSFFFFRFLSILLWGQQGQQSPSFGKFSLFFFFVCVCVCVCACVCWLLQDLVVRPRLGDLFVSQNPRGVCASLLQI